MYQWWSCCYDRVVPKLWDETIETHRAQVRDAICDTTAALVFEHGLRAVTMAQIAEQTGIGRATLYKYFADVDAIMHAWHARQLGSHLAELTEIRDSTTEPDARLDAVLTSLALIAHRSAPHHRDLVRFGHRDEHVAAAQQQLHDLVRRLIADAATAGHIRTDTRPSELATYCLHALSAAADLPSKPAARRLAAVTLTGLGAR
jgi:AcrR family transcriptional regulator